MKNLKIFMESGILESYVSGNLSSHDIALVEQMAGAYREVREEIDCITEAVEMYAFSLAKIPDPTLKPFLLATIDFTERMKKGETPSFPPELNISSKVSDYAEWLCKPDMVLPDYFTDLHAKIIGYTPASTTAIVWIKEMAPQEVHHNEYEKFLIVEGTCNIIVGDDFYPMVPGDYFSIPLHKDHQVIVTSLNPCKVILQRIAA